MSIKTTVAALCVCFLSSLTLAYSNHDAIEISHPWARTSAPGAPSAGFMLVSNHTDEADVLLAVKGDFAKKLEVHQTKQVDGVMKMIHQQDGVVIPAGGEVLFKPGSYHLMFMGLSKNFELGEQYKVILTFKQAGDIELVLPVKEMQDSTMAH